MLIKRLSLIFISLVSIVLLLVLLTGLWLATEHGTKNVLKLAQNQMDGLMISHQAGGVFGKLQLSRVSFSNPQIEIDVTDLTVDIDWYCSLNLQLCFESIALNQLTLRSKASADDQQASADTSDIIRLPFLLDVSSFVLNRFELHDDSEYDDADHMAPNSSQTLKMSIQQIDSSFSFFEHFDLSHLQIERIDLLSSDKDELQSQASSPVTGQAQPLASLKTSLALLSTEYAGMEVPSVFIPIEFDIKQVNLKQFCYNQDELCLNDMTLASSHFEQQLNAQLNLLNITANEPLSAGEKVLKDLSNLSLNAQVDINNQLSTSLKLTSDSVVYQALVLDTTLDLNSIDASLNAGVDEQGVNIMSLRADIDVFSPKLPASLNTEISYLPYQSLLFSEQAPALWQNDTKLNLSIEGELSDYLLTFEAQKLTIKGFEPKRASANIGWLDSKLSLTNVSLESDLQNNPLTVSGDLNVNADGLINANEFVISSQGLYASISGNAAIWDVSLPTELTPLKLKFDLKDLSQLLLQTQGEGNNTYTGVLDLEATLYSPLVEPIIELEARADDIQLADMSLEKLRVTGNINTQNKLASRMNAELSNLSLSSFELPELSLDLNGNEQMQSLRLSIPKGEIRTEQLFTGRLIYTQDNAQALEVSAWEGEWSTSTFMYKDMSVWLSQTSKLNFDFDTQLLEMSAACWQGNETKEDAESLSVAQLCVQSESIGPESAKIEVSTQLDVIETLALLDFDSHLASLDGYVDVNASNAIFDSNTQIQWDKQSGLTIESSSKLADLVLINNGKAIVFQHATLTSTLAKDSLHNRLDMRSVGFGSILYDGYFNKLSASDKSQRTHDATLLIDSINLSRLDPFSPQLDKIDGNINAELDISGMLATPQILGKVSVSDGELLIEQIPLRLTNWQQTIEFQGRELNTQGNFNLGVYDQGGEAQLKAYIDFSDAFVVEGSLRGTDLALAYDTHLLEVSPNLRFEASPQRINLEGGVAIPSAKLVIKTLPASAQSPSLDINVVDKESSTDSLGPQVFADLEIYIDPDMKKKVQLEALDLKTALHGDLNLQVDPKNTSLSGKINLVDGEYNAYGQALLVQQGEISFTGLPQVPNLDIRAIRNPLNTADEVIAGISVTGTSQQPVVELFSDPGMDQAKQLSYLLTGRDFDKPGESTDSQTMLVNTLLSFGIGRSENGIGRLGRSFGVDNLNLQTSGQGDSTQIQVSGQLSENIQVSYGLGVFDSISELKLRYNMLPQVYIEAVSGLNNALDIYYEIERQ